MFEKIIVFLLGDSWRTSLFGLIGGFFLYFSQVGMIFPSTLGEWGSAVVAAGLYAWGRVMGDSKKE